MSVRFLWKRFRKFDAKTYLLHALGVISHTTVISTDLNIYAEVVSFLSTLVSGEDSSGYT